MQRKIYIASEPEDVYNFNILRMLQNKDFSLEEVSDMKRICMAGLSILLVISGVLIYKNVGAERSNALTLEEAEAILKEYTEGNPKGLTPEQIQEVLKEYAESYPRDLTREDINELAGGNVVSYGSSGVGYINHETGESIVYVTDSGDER